MTGPSGNSEFCFPSTSMFPSTSPRGTLSVSGKQNSLFPLWPVIKCLLTALFFLFNPCPPLAYMYNVHFNATVTHGFVNFFSLFIIWLYSSPCRGRKTRQPGENCSEQGKNNNTLDPHVAPRQNWTRAKYMYSWGGSTLTTALSLLSTTVLSQHFTC